MKPTNQPNQLSAFAVTAPGLEALCTAELAALRIRGTAEEGGVAFKGSLEHIARANLWLRTASRVLVRAAEFRATAFFEVEKQAKQLPWKKWVAPGGEVEFRVTCRKSKLYHSDAVAQRFATAVEWEVRGVKAIGGKDADKDADEDETTPSEDRQLFVVRFVKDVCTVSVDSSGALLHFRGYRQQLAKAPLRETLAAAVLLGSGWKGDTPFDDPMCGSGTIPIEAALMARRIAPGSRRSFAFQRWPGTDAGMWTTMLEAARVAELPASPVAIAGADRDEGAIAAAKANAERAGVAKDITFSVQPVSGLSAAAGSGLVASNPPYGVRIGDTGALRNLYAQFGNVVRRQRPGWDVALLSADRPLEHQTRLPFEDRLRTKNGGIPVHLVVARVPA